MPRAERSVSGAHALEPIPVLEAGRRTLHIGKKGSVEDRAPSRPGVLAEVAAWHRGLLRNGGRPPSVGLQCVEVGRDSLQATAVDDESQPSPWPRRVGLESPREMRLVGNRVLFMRGIVFQSVYVKYS